MVMVTKEIIQSEIEKVPTERLEELYEVVKVYSRGETENNGRALLAKLKTISIDEPADFSENLDLYL
ncbi:MAG TPA: hypothetical protein DC047_16840 [Blastocatellia bacterium]|nr:hypothetical protein [Blastocatellia bacterium]